MHKAILLSGLLLLGGCSQEKKTDDVVDTTLPDSNQQAPQPAPQPIGDTMGEGSENLQDMADQGPSPPSQDNGQPLEDTDLAHGPIASSPGAWVTQDDYPPAALREGRGGITQISYRVDPYGRVINCQVVDGTGSPDLDQTTCRLFTRRGRFRPATDQAGNPVESEDQTFSIQWNPNSDR